MVQHCFSEVEVYFSMKNMINDTIPLLMVLFSAEYWSYRCDVEWRSWTRDILTENECLCNGLQINAWRIEDWPYYMSLHLICAVNDSFRLFSVWTTIEPMKRNHQMLLETTLYSCRRMQRTKGSWAMHSANLWFGMFRSWPEKKVRGLVEWNTPLVMLMNGRLSNMQ